MRRTRTCMAASVILVAMGAQSAAKDLLMVVLQTADGRREMHYQASPNCREFLKGFAKAKREGRPVTLTFKEPPAATGEVLEAYCIMPDGRAMRPDGTMFKP